MKGKSEDWKKLKRPFTHRFLTQMYKVTSSAHPVARDDCHRMLTVRLLLASVRAGIRACDLESDKLAMARAQTHRARYSHSSGLQSVLRFGQNVRSAIRHTRQSIAITANLFFLRRHCFICRARHSLRRIHCSSEVIDCSPALRCVVALLLLFDSSMFSIHSPDGNGGQRKHHVKCTQRASAALQVRGAALACTCTCKLALVLIETPALLFDSVAAQVSSSSGANFLHGTRPTLCT